MKAAGMLMKILDPEGGYDASMLYDEPVFKAALGKISPAKYKELGEKILNAFLADHPAGFEDLKTCFADLYRIFTFFLKEEGIGILKSLEFRKGFMKLSDNLILPCAVTQSAIAALLKKMGLKGVHVKETRCKLDGFKFCEYQAVWISSNV